MADRFQHGRGFIQPNTLLQAAQTTAGVVLNATGTVRIVETTTTSRAATGFGGGGLASSSSVLGGSAASGGGAPAVRTRGRGANAPAAGDATAPTSAAPAVQTVTVERTAPRARKDLVEVPYANRVWRNTVLQYCSGGGAIGSISNNKKEVKVVDPTPLALLGCGVPNVAGVKGVEPYYSPSTTALAMASSSAADDKTSSAAGPFKASLDAVFAKAVRSFTAAQRQCRDEELRAAAFAEMFAAAGHQGTNSDDAALTAAAEAKYAAAKRTADEAAAAVAAAEAADRQVEASQKAADDAEAKAMGYRAGGGFGASSSDEDDSEDDGAADGADRRTVRLPMMRPPVNPAALTVKMRMVHTASGSLNFTYTDYDGVMGDGVVPLIGGTTTTDGGASSSSAAAAADGLDEDDEEIVDLDGKAAGGERVSAYLNPKARSNQQYFVKKTDLSADELNIFETLWKQWRAGGPQPNPNRKRGREPTAADVTATAGGANRSNDADDAGSSSFAGGHRAEASSSAPAPSDAAPSASAEGDADAEIRRMRRAAEEALAGLDRDW